MDDDARDEATRRAHQAMAATVLKKGCAVVGGTAGCFRCGACPGGGELKTCAGCHYARRAAGARASSLRRTRRGEPSDRSSVEARSRADPSADGSQTAL